MTKQRKLYAAILVVAIAALVLDRALLDGGSSAPGPAAAAPANHPAAIPAAERAAAATAADGGAEEAQRLLRRVANGAPGSEPTRTLAYRLTRLAEQHALAPDRGPDAFTPDPAWIPPRQAEPDPGTGRDADSAEAQRDPSARFVARHRLRAVLATGDGGLAILAGRADPIRVGETLDGFTLTAVTARAATFEAGEMRAVLDLDAP